MTSLHVASTHCEYRATPLGIDTPNPRLGWTLASDSRGARQRAYHLRVATDRQRLERDAPDLWDSGRVSAHATQAVYGGATLHSGQPCWWSVRVWDEHGTASPWSEPDCWEMGLLDATAWQGEWINDGRALPTSDAEFYQEEPAPLFRRPFRLEKPVAAARLYLAATGYVEASLNGRKVGDHLLDPGWTHYGKRILYSTYNVTDLLDAHNCLGVRLGNGWFNPLPLRLWSHRNIRDALPTGRPAFIAQLNIRYADGTGESIASDGAWRWREGPLLRNSIYLGELYDARAEIDAWDLPQLDERTWHAAAKAPKPAGVLQAQFQPPIRTTATLSPTAITEPEPGVFICDMGQNFAGAIRLSVDAPRGTRIALRYGELLYADGTLNPMTSVCGQIKGLRDDGTPMGGPGAPEIAWQEDVYIAKGEPGERYTPTFTWHAFRYVEIRGLAKAPMRDAITGLRQNSDVAAVGSFACSNELFNRIQKVTEWTFLSNLFSVQSDCPHRERLGYGGDLVVTAEAFMANFDMAQFYAKAVRDWADAAREDGRLTDTAPFVGIDYCGLGWAMAHPLLLALLYQVYGNRQLIAEQYASAARWLALVGEQYPGHIIERGLSDHEALERGTPPAMVTPLYYQCACIMARLADILARDDEADAYRQLATQIASAYTASFLQRGTGVFEPGTQAAQAFALYAGLVSDEEKPAALKHLVDDISRHDGHLTTGIFGTKYLLEVLSESGHADTAYELVNTRDFPGWGYMIEQGATTLWENWAFSDNTYSHNHPMFGSVSEWFYRHVAGIRIDADAVGADRVTIHPTLTHKLQWARAAYRSLHGEMACHWYWETDVLHVDVTIPVGTTATLYLPAGNPASIMEGGAPVSEAAGVALLRMEEGKVLYQLEAGTYAFTSTRPI